MDGQMYEWTEQVQPKTQHMTYFCRAGWEAERLMVKKGSDDYGQEEGEGRANQHDIQLLCTSVKLTLNICPINSREMKYGRESHKRVCCKL